MSWIRKKKKYTKPRKAYDKVRIEEENILVKKYGLKNKREIWKADSAVKRVRNQAKKLITSSKEEQESLFKKLNKIGFKAEKIADILAMTKEDWLKRRLQSILIIKGLAKPKQARQLITHKHIFIDGKVVNVPGKIININEEDKIQIMSYPKKDDPKNKLLKQENSIEDKNG